MAGEEDSSSGGKAMQPGVSPDVPRGVPVITPRHAPGMDLSTVSRGSAFWCAGSQQSTGHAPSPCH